MKYWLETLLGVALVAAWSAVALTASEATVREGDGPTVRPVSAPVSLKADGATTVQPPRV